MKQIIIVLRGSAGTGKTALMRAMVAGQKHLVGVPILQDAIERGFGVFDLASINSLLDQKQPFLPTIRKLMGDKPYLLSDTCVNVNRVVEECAGEYTIIILWLFAPGFLVAARRKVRYAHHKDDPTQAQLEGVLPDEKQLDDVIASFTDWADVETVLVDACDFPMRETTVGEVREMVTGTVREPDPLPVAQMYQQAVWLGGKQYGTTDKVRQRWEHARLESILPADLTGKTLLDIGASEGGMCYEAIHRGAIYATSVEVRELQVALAQHIRNCEHLPITTCRMDIVSDSLPRLNAHEQLLRYDVGLMLNLLHHCKDPEAVFAKVLEACNSAIIETPFGIGEVPYKPGLPPYPNAMHLPPAWVQAVGKEHGFVLAAIEVSEMCPGQRLIYRLERT